MCTLKSSSWLRALMRSSSSWIAWGRSVISWRHALTKTTRTRGNPSAILLRHSGNQSDGLVGKCEVQHLQADVIMIWMKMHMQKTRSMLEAKVHYFVKNTNPLLASGYLSYAHRLKKRGNSYSASVCKRLYTTSWNSIKLLIVAKKELSSYNIINWQYIIIIILFFAFT